MPLVPTQGLSNLLLQRRDLLDSLKGEATVG